MKIKFLILTILFNISALISCMKSDNQSGNQNECKLSTQSSNRVLGGCKVKDADNVPGAKSSVFLKTKYNFCTGTFIQPHVILSAAHCFSNRDMEDNLSIKTVKDSETIVERDSVPIKSKVSINSVYSKTQFFGDIALIYTNKSATDMEAHVAKITSKIHPDEVVFFVGFGVDKDNDTFKGIIKRWGRARIKTLVDTSDTKDIFKLILKSFDEIIPLFKESRKNDPEIQEINTTKDFKKYLSINEQPEYSTPFSTFVYAEGSENESGLCSGDSGGGIYVKRNNDYAVVGVASAVVSVLKKEETKCSNKKSISSLIAAYSDFINHDLEKHGYHKLEFIN